MKAQELSPLEAAVAATFYELYRDRGFPAPNTLRVRQRENTGSGRYVDLEPIRSGGMENGYVDLGGKFIVIAGVPNGLMATARIRDHHLDQIELAVYGNDPWNGEEREWAIV